MVGNENDENGVLAANDPYNEMERSDIRPEIGQPESKKQVSTSAHDRLTTAEKTAVNSNVSVVSGGTDVARSTESSQTYSPRYSGEGLPEGEDKKKKGFLGGKGPLVMIMALLLGGGGLMVGVQSLFPFHLVQQATGMFDGSYTSRTSRMSKFTKWLFNLENDETKVTKYSGVFHKTQKYRRIGGSKQVRLEAQGISVLPRGSAIPNDTLIPEGTTLRFSDGSEITLGNSVQMRPDNTMLAGATLKDGVLVYRNGDIDTLVAANKYGEFYENDADFRSDFNRGARSWVGRIAAWIDLSVARFLKNHNITRNIFKNWRNRVFAAEGADTTFTDIIRGAKPTRSTSFDTETVEDNSGKTDVNGDPVDSTRTKARLEAADMINNIAKTASNVACAVSAVSATVSAIKTAQALNNARLYVSSIFEAVDKVKYGDGSDSPIHESSTEFVRRDSNGNSAAEAEGMRLILSGGSYDPNRFDPNTLSTNIETAFKNAGATVGALIGCSIAKAVFAVVSFALTIFTFGTFSIGKALISIAAGTVIGVVVNAGVEAIIESVKTDFCLDSDDALVKGSCAALGANSYLSGNFQEGGGTPGTKEKVASFYDANQLALAREAEYERETRSPFDLTSSNTFLGSIVAQLMPYISSTTSLTGVLSAIGSLASNSLSSMMPTAGAVEKAQYLNNIIGNCPNLESLGAVGDLYCNPIYISDMDTMEMDPEQNSYDLFCAAWDETGTKCTRVRTSGFGENFKSKCVEWDEWGNCISYVIDPDSDGNEVINPKSNLGKFLLYCSNRTSQYGIVDQNIINMESNFMDARTENSTVNIAANSIIGGVPLLGDIVDIVNSGQALNALPWATGSNCVARDSGADYLSQAASSGQAQNENGAMVNTLGGNSVPTGWNTVDWSEMRTYQRYIEDDRLLQATDEDYRSPVLAFWEAIEEEYPTDWSYEGILARQTGMTKDQVIAGLEEMEKEEFLAQYDPTDLGPLPAAIEAEVSLSDILPEGVIADHTDVLQVQYIVYADTRNRSYAI